MLPDYIDLRNATESSAATLYGANSTEWIATRAAWDVVGVPRTGLPSCGIPGEPTSLYVDWSPCYGVHEVIWGRSSNAAITVPTYQLEFSPTFNFQVPQLLYTVKPDPSDQTISTVVQVETSGYMRVRACNTFEGQTACSLYRGPQQAPYYTICP